MKERYYYSLVCIALMGLLIPIPTQGSSSNITYQTDAFPGENRERSEIVIFSPRQEFVDSFERSTLAPWTTYGYPGSVVMRTFGMRDTTNVYGPQSPAHSGYRYAGHPSNDAALYPSPGQNPGNATCLESPTIDLTGWDSLFISFSYWGDFEGNATNFDGFIVQISSDNGGTWKQIDSAHLGHMVPSYDARLAGTGLLGTRWAYCYDTRPNWVDVASQNLIPLGYVAPGNQIKIRFVFAYDALDGGQGCFIDDIRIASTPPLDLQPPIIEHAPLEDSPDTSYGYTVVATITDPGSGVNSDSVSVYYRVEDGPWNRLPMQLVGTDIYEALIPPQHYHTDIYYYIRALDNAGNSVNTLTYNFEVTNAILIYYDDGQPYWIPGGLSVGSGMFVRFDFAPVGIDSGRLHEVKYFFSRAGNFDLRVYTIGSGGAPGQLVYTKPNLQSPGYEWYAEEITNANLRMTTGAVVGFIVGQPIGNDTVNCLMDPGLNYQQNMWFYVNGQWGNPTSGGDFMIRLKVIPLPELGVREKTAHKLSLPSLRLMPNLMSAQGGNIQYQVPKPGSVQLKVFDAAGRLIKNIVNDYQEAGNYTVNWDACDESKRKVPPGIYFVVLEIEKEQITSKAVVVR